MSVLTKYILKKYLIHFFIVLISLEIFFVGMDFLQNSKKMPDSANLQLLYLMYNSFFSLLITLPLSLVFGWIITVAIFVKNNELVAFFSLGAKRFQVYIPIIITALSFLIVQILFQMTPMAYSYEQKSKILDGNYFVDSKSDIFLKYNENYIYFEKLYPIKKEAENIHIYRVVEEDIDETIIAKKAIFQNDKWYIVDAKVIKKPRDLNFETSKLEVRHEKFLNTLDGFKPKILDNVYESKGQFSILDALSALILLSKQDVNTDKIRAILYYEVFVPFFIIPLIFIIFAFTSSNRRFFNLGAFMSLSIFGTLIVWGIFFILYKFANNGLLQAEFLLGFPMIAWYLGTFYIYKRKVGFND